MKNGNVNKQVKSRQLSSTEQTYIDEKIKFWKNFSIILGLIIFFGFIITNITINEIDTVNDLNNKPEAIVLISLIFTFAWKKIVFVSSILSLFCLIRIVILSSRRKKHILKDYIVTILGMILTFLPYAIFWVSSLFTKS